MPSGNPENQERSDKLDLLQGTLDLMVLQTLATMGSLALRAMHTQLVEQNVQLQREIVEREGVEAALQRVRLQQRGWISAEWGTSDNNRKAKYYSITRAGRKQWARDTAYWLRLSTVMGRVLAMPVEGEV